MHIHLPSYIRVFSTKVKWTVALKEWAKIGSRWGMLNLTFTNVVPKWRWPMPNMRYLTVLASEALNCIVRRPDWGYCSCITGRPWILVSDPWLLRYCYGRLTFAVKYKNSLKERGAGFLPSMIGEKWIEGLTWHVWRGCSVAVDVTKTLASVKDW